jgi:hypothetical protein
MEPEEQDFAEQLNHNRLTKAYLRLATEAQRIKESPGVTAVKGEVSKPPRKPKKPKEQPPEQLRLF